MVTNGSRQGNITYFLESEHLSQVFKTERRLFDLIESHYSRLSEEQKDIFHWLVVSRKAVTLREICSDLFQMEPLDKNSTLELEVKAALINLGERIPILSSNISKLYSLQSVILEYGSEKIKMQAVKELKEKSFYLLKSHALMRASYPEYIKEQQKTFLLEPISKEASLTKKDVFKLIDSYRPKSLTEDSYLAGNLINLLLNKDSSKDSGSNELVGADLSKLSIKQVDFSETQMRETDFTNSTLSECFFREDFGTVVSIDTTARLIDESNDIYESNLVAGTTSGDVYIWSTTEDSETRVQALKAHDDWVWALAFSPDGESFVTAGGDGLIKIWKDSSPETLRPPHSGRVRAIAFSKDGRFVVSGGEDEEIKLWNVETRNLEKAFLGNREWSNTLDFSYCGSFIAEGSANTRRVRIMSIESGSTIAEFGDFPAVILKVCFSPDGRYLAISGHHSEVWLISTQTWLLERKLTGIDGRVRDLSFSKDNKIAACSSSKYVRVWDLDSDNFSQTFKGYTKPVRTVAFSQRSNTVWAGGEDQTLKLWDIRRNECLRTMYGYSNPIWSTIGSQKSSIIFTGDEEGCLRIWDVEKAIEDEGDIFREGLLISNQSENSQKTHNNLIRFLAIEEDKKLVASGSYDGQTKVWKYSIREESRLLFTCKPRNKIDRVISADFHPYKTLIAITYYYGECVRVYDYSSNEVVESLSLRNSSEELIRGRSAVFSPDGNRLAISTDKTENNWIQIYDLPSRKYLDPLKGHNDAIWGLNFDPVLGRLASCDASGEIRVWNIHSGNSTVLQEPNHCRTRSIRFSHDGRYIVSGDDSNSIKVWDVSRNLEVARLTDHQSWIWSVSFVNNSQFIVSASEDGTAKLWDFKKNECLCTLQPKRPYEDMNITNLKGLNPVQVNTLKALGAREDTVK
jgi:WD40 repeat protein